MRKVVRKADIVLGITLVILCAAACWYAYSSGSSGTFVTVTVNGDEYGTYPLNQDDTVDIDTEYGHNTLVIKDGKALMTEASCPDGYCLGQYKQSGGIDVSNQTIVCLPNRVAVSVKSDGSRDADQDEGGTPDIVSGTASGQISDDGGQTRSGQTQKGGEADAQDRK